MIGTSNAEYMFIRFWVIILSYVAPISIFYCIAVSLSPLLPNALSSFRLHALLEGWLVAETLFFFCFFVPYRYYLQRAAVHPAPTSREERSKLFARCMEHINDPEAYLSRWFFGAKPEDLRQENVEEFLSWAFFDTAKVEPEDEDELESYTKAFEKKLQRDIPPGRGSATSLRLTLGQVALLHRSLVWYMCIFVVDMITHCSMLFNGFQLYRTAHSRFFHIFPVRPLTLFTTHVSTAKHVTYWHREHTAKDRLPILFIHGIGVGLYPYTNFLGDINTQIRSTPGEGDIGIIALEVMPVSSRITHAALDKDVMVGEILEIVKYHGWTKFVLVSHSYGSVITTHLLKSPLTAPLVGPVILVDPVSFLLHLPDVAYNFIARKPKRANELQMWYFGSMDMGVAHTLARRFFWSTNIIWKEDLMIEDKKQKQFRDVTVALSGRDLIVDTKAVRHYLTDQSPSEGVTENKVTPLQSTEASTTDKPRENGAVTHRPWTGSGLEVIWSEDLDHAQIFDRAHRWTPLVTAIQTYSAKDAT